MPVSNSFLTSREALRMGHAVAAVLVQPDGRYLMQRRDDIASIWYPGHWGFFGGSIEPGEDEIAALRRELCEELEFELAKAKLIIRLDFDLTPLGLGKYFRSYYQVPVTAAALERLVLHEGAEMWAFDGDAALSLLRLSPYDAFALFLHHQRERLIS